ncbi:MAG: hybrid sensor histidine kinase/response regulator [Acidimicrobiales bacterium]|jgi:signal transduction histidine kinase
MTTSTDNSESGRSLNDGGSPKRRANALKLLLVEDSPSDAMLIGAYLQEGLHGSVELARVQTLESGLSWLSEDDIDAVLLDLGLPDSSGLNTYQRVQDEFPDMPVVIISALAGLDVAKRAVSLGAQDFVIKGDLTPTTLARAVIYAVARQGVLFRHDRVLHDEIATKDRFLSHVSHELRTPLAAIHQFVSLVADETTGPLLADQRECLEGAMRNIRQLSSMVDDLLAVTRLGSALIDVHPKPAAIADLVSKCAADFLLLAKEREIDLEVNLPSLPDVWCDPARVTEVLNNLLDNAVKFAPSKGRIVISASTEDAFVHIKVWDSGSGVTPELRERVFESFFQENRNEDSGRAGLGLGLYVCRQLVELQGGRIWIDNSLATNGSSFTLSLPTTKPSSNEAMKWRKKRSLS